MKPIYIVLLAGGLLVGGVLWEMKKASDRLLVSPFFYPPRIPDFWRIILPLDVKLKNPTGGRLKVNYPFVEVMIGDSVLGSSQSKREPVIIRGYGEAMIKGIEIEIPLLNLPWAAGALLDFVRGKSDKVDLKVRVSTSADALLFTFPVSIVTPYTIERRASQN